MKRTPMLASLGESLLAPMLAAAVVALAAAPSAAACNLYGWTISASSTDPFDNSTLTMPGVRDLYLWLACTSNDGLAAAEFDLITGGGLTLQGTTPLNDFVNSGSGAAIRLTHSSGCVFGPVVAAKLTFLDTGPGAVCFAPSSDNGRNATLDCGATSPEWWTNDFVGFATIAEGPCASPSFCDPPDADLRLAKIASESQAAVGERFEYTLTVVNDGPDAACGVRVSDSLPSGVDYISSVAERGTYDEGSGSWWIGDLEVGTNVGLTIEVEIASGNPGDFVWNFADVAGGIDDANPANDADSVAVEIAAPPSADLSVAKIANVASAPAGSEFDYRITVTNAGPDAATAVEVHDPLPAGLSFVSATAEMGTYDPGTGVWAVPSVTNGTDFELTIRVAPQESAIGTTIRNHASVTAATGDPNAGNDADSVDVQVVLPEITVVLPEVEAQEGSPSTVTIEVSNADYVDDVELQFRRGGQAAFTGVPMTRVSGTAEYRATVPPGQVTKAGVQYFCTVTTTNATTLRFPADGYGTINVEFEQPVEVTMPAEQFRLLGLPLIPERGGDPLSVFDELGEYDPFEWRYGTFDGTGYLDGPGTARNLQPGVGFWLYDRQGRTLGVYGQSTPLDEPFLVTVPVGWSIVANPFPFSIDAADVVRGTGVSADFVAWTGTEYQHFAAQLEPGRGYWVFNGSTVAQTLLFPVDVVPSGRASTDPWRPDEAGDGWFASLRVTAGDLEDAGNYFGMASAASAALDPYDFRESPTPPGRFVQMSFARDGARLQVDSRAPADGAVWDVVVATGGVDEPVRLAAEQAGELPAGWRLIALAGRGLHRWDLGAGEVIADARALDDLRVIAGTPEFVADSVSRLEIEGAREVAGLTLAVGPNPMSGHATISLGVSRRTSASLVVFDLSGRLVRTLHRGPLDAGIHRFAWDGRESSGARVGAGVYFVQAEAAEATRTAKVIFLP